MKKLWLVLSAAVFAGCTHSTSTSTSTQAQQNLTMQAGQWEIALVPMGGNAGNPIVIEANLTASGNTVASTVFNTEVFQQGGPDGGCGDETLSGTISGSLLSGMLIIPGNANPDVSLSNGEIASNGQSVTNGTYTSSSGNACVYKVGSSGTFTAVAVSPLNGTYAGTISGSGKTEQLNVTISQDASFGITADGTDNCSSSNSSFPCLAPSMTLHISPVGPGYYSNVIGRLLGVPDTKGSGLTTPSGQTYALSFVAYFDQSAQSLLILSCCSDDWHSETGLLSKQ